jgi:hypothetical protein
MIDLSLTLGAIKNETATVLRAAQREKITSLKTSGAFLRQILKQDILRKRKRPSQPGQAPSIHASGTASLRNIRFIYDPGTETVVVGPVKLNQREQSWIDLGATTVPQLLNFGDVITIEEVSTTNGRTWRRRDKRRHPRPTEIYRKRRAAYQPRPFMQLAYQLASRKLPDMFSDTRRPVLSS